MIILRYNGYQDKWRGNEVWKWQILFWHIRVAYYIHDSNDVYLLIFLIFLICLTDYILDADGSNLDVFEIVKPTVNAAINGFNGTVFAYGQTNFNKIHYDR